MTETKSRIVRIPYDPENHHQWLSLRKRGLGGSDAATVVGLNPWSSKLALYADKMGLSEEKPDNEAMRQGRDLEAYVAERWAEVTGKAVQRVNAILFNEDYPFALANIDRKVVGEKAGLECKTTSVYNRSDFENGEIPPQYYTQCVHYMAVTGYDRWYLAVAVLNKAFHVFTIDRNEKEIAALMEAERIFWEEHVVKGNPPDPDGSESSMAILDNKIFIDDTELMPDAEDLFDELERVQGMLKEYEDEKDELKQKIIARLGNKARGQAQKWTVTYLPQERTSIDRAKLLKLFPQAYGECAETKTFRTFRTKKNKGEK